MKNFYLLLASFCYLFILTNKGLSQKPQENFLLDSKETGNRNYVAKDQIILADGFSFTAKKNESFSAKIDQFLLFPPSDKTYKALDGKFTDNLNEGSVVGSIPAAFNVTPAGAASYQVPIQCPPGINGLEPSLSLTYNSQSGVGLGSLNFTLTGVSCIERVSHRYCYDSDSHPVSFDGNDRFSLNGKRLMLISPGNYGADGATYGFEIEDYSRITSNGAAGDGPSWFRLQTKDGKILEFGRTSDSKMILSDNAGIYKWYLNKVTDRNGNYIKYFYDSKADGETWISRIEYTGNENTGISAACTVEFGYYSMSDLGLTSGSLPKYIAGNEHTTEKVLKEIITNSSSEIYRKYTLAYDINNTIPFLKSINVENRNGEKMPETVFEWQNGFPASEKIPNIDGKSVVSGDFTGDGKDNILKATYDVNSNKCRLEVLELKESDTWEMVKSGEVGNYNDVTLINCGDFSGDGVDDLILKLNNGSHIIDGNTLEEIVSGNGFSDEELLHESILGDYRGNGRVGCIIVTESGFYLLMNNAVISLATSDQLDISTIGKICSGDFNGDGKTEVLIRRDNDLRIYTLDNQFGLELIKRINRTTSNCFVGDFNNDEVSDLIIQKKGEPNKIYYFSDFNMLVDSEILPSFSIESGIPHSKYHQYLNSEILSNKIITAKFGSKGSNGILLSRKTKSTIISSLQNEFYDPAWDSRTIEERIHDWETDFERVLYNLGVNGYLFEWKKKIYSSETNPIHYYEITVYSSGFNYLQRSFMGRKTWIRQSVRQKGMFPFQIKDVFLADFRGIGRNYLTLRGSNKDGYETMDRIGSFYDVSDYYAVESINEGMDNTYQINYGPMISEALSKNPLYSKENNGSYPIFDLAGSFRLVSSVDLPNGDRRSYYYRGGKTHLEGKGFLGFKKVISKSSSLDIETESQYSMVDDLNILIPSKKMKRLTSNQTPIETKTSLFSSSKDGNNRYILRPNEKKVEDHLNNTTKTIDFETYDDDGNLKRKTISYGDGVSVTEETSLFLKKGSLFKNKPSDLIVTKRNSSGSEVRETTFQYDSNGNVTSKVVDPEDENMLETNFKSYNGFGLPETIEHIANGETRIIELEYSNSGRFVKKKTDINKGSFIRNEYNEKTGLLDYEIDDRGRKTTYEYDGFGRLINTTYPNGVHTVNVLQWAGGDGPEDAQYFSYQETSGQSPVWKWYDNLGRKLRVDYFGLDKKISVSTTYNNGLLEFESQPYFTDEGSTEGTTYTYDDYGRLETETNQNGMTSYKYPALKKEITSPRGTRKKVFNSAGQVTTSTVDGKMVEYTYWPSEQMKTATPENGEAVQYFYDLQGNPEKIIDPDAGVIEKSYNGFGELIQEVRDVHISGNSEVVTTYEYVNGGMIDFVHINGEKTNYGYDDHNRLETIVIDGQHSITIEYGDYDRIIRQSETIKGEKTYISEKKYDKYGRIIEEIYPTGYSVSKSYNEYGVLKSLSDSNGKKIWRAVEENSFGQLTKVKKGEKELNYGFDNKGLPEYIKSNGIIDRSYGFTPDGNLEYCIDNHLTTNITINQKEEFIYDDNNRLRDWMIYKDNDLVDVGYIAYDLNSGNIKGKSGINYEMKYGEDGYGPHAVTSIMGKPSSFPADERNISYTDFSKVKEITEGNKKLDITYGVNQQRIKMMLDDGGQTLTRYYQANFEEEIKGGSSRKIHYISANDGLAAIFIQDGNAENLYYTYTDHLGSLVAISDDDGNLVERFAYDPWGNRRDPNDWTKRITTPVSEITARGYTMHEHLDAFDLINMNGRVYDPLTSRFLSADPFIQAPGQWLNYDRYAYAMNNPMIYNDPNGYFFKKFGKWLNKQWNDGWDALNQFATWADKTDGFPSSGGAGINSAGNTWHYLGNSGNIYHNQLGNDYGGVVNAAINDARGSVSFVNESSLMNVAANSGGDGYAQTLFFLGLGLTADGAQGGARIFQKSNAGVRAAAVRNNFPTTKIDKIMGNTNNFATGTKWAGRIVIVVGASISIYQGYSAYNQGNKDGVTKAGLDLGIGIGSAAIGGIPGVLLYGGYMMIMLPLPGNPSGYITPLCVPDNTYVAPTIIPRF